MMNAKNPFFKNISRTFLALFLITALVSSCKKDDKATPIEEIPGFPVNTTISELLEDEGENKVISKEAVLWGFVTAAGATQNAPSMVWLQDDDAGLALKVEPALLEKFPAGTLVFVKAKGLALKREGSFLVLGNLEGNDLKALNEEKVGQHIGFGAKGQVVATKDVSMGQVSAAHHQMVVNLKDVEIANEYLNSTFGSTTEERKEVILQDCAGNEVYLVTNKDAAVASTAIKSGRGDIVGLVTVHNNRKEIRLLSAAAADGLTAVRCNGSGDITLSRKIGEIVALGAGGTIAANTEIKVVTISSAVSEPTGGITVQDQSGGIYIPVTGNYPLGSALIIKVGGKKVVSLNGRLSIEGVTAADIQLAGSYEYPAKIVTVANMVSGNLAHTLVQINDAQVLLYDTKTTEKVYRIRDNSGKLNLTLANASAITLAEGTASVSGYFITENGEAKFRIRNAGDVVAGGVAPAADPDYIVETFQTAPAKGLYPVGNVNAPSGIWIFNGALLYGSEPKDWRPMSPRLLGINNRDAALPGPGFIQNSFELAGLKRIRVEYVSHNDPADIGPVFRVRVNVSTDNGVTWTSLGTKDTGKSQVATADFMANIPKSQKVLVKIINESPQPPGVTLQLFRGNRINILKVILEKD